MSEATALRAVEISANSYRIEDGGVRAFLFIGQTRALLADTGFESPESLRELVSSLTAKPVLLVNTHADGDHIGRNGQFGTARMHADELPYYYESCPDAPVEPLGDGDVLDIGGRRFEVLHIPGHTRGSVALLDRENRVLVSGDSVSRSPVFMFGEMRDLNAYIASMERLAGLMGAFDVVYPSHGEFPAEPAQIEKQLAAAGKLLAGELTPEEPPFDIPAKLYKYGGAAFFY